MDRRNFIKGAMAVPAVALTAKMPIYKHKDITGVTFRSMKIPNNTLVTPDEVAEIWSDGLKEQFAKAYDKDMWHLD